jgi:hypothetical protein
MMVVAAAAVVVVIMVAVVIMVVLAVVSWFRWLPRYLTLPRARLQMTYQKRVYVALPWLSLIYDTVLTCNFHCRVGGIFVWHPCPIRGATTPFWGPRPSKKYRARPAVFGPKNANVGVPKTGSFLTVQGRCCHAYTTATSANANKVFGHGSRIVIIGPY